jgi:hypothetical protein
MLKAGNREVYDQRRAATAERVHKTECLRCGPAGKPALPGSPWSAGHQLADALRIVSKEQLLKNLWREARRIHELSISDQLSVDIQDARITDRDQFSIDSHMSNDTHWRGAVDRDQTEETA